MKKQHEELIATARKRLAEAYDAETDNRKMAEDDLRFLVGDQWPQQVREAREAENKPCLTINALPQYSRQVTGQIRALNPAVKVLPADKTAQVEVADIYEGLIRQIEYHAGAEYIYEAAGESAAQCGIGNWRILADYCDGDTFDQEIKIARISNPFAVFWDPNARETTREDAGYCFILSNIPRETFKEEYPDAAEVDISNDHDPDTFVHWTTGEHVVVGEYFWKEFKEHKVGLTPDGQVIRDPKPPMNYEKTRTVRVPVVKWVKMTGQEVLEGPKEFPSRYIPVVAVTGEEISLGEKLYRSSVIRFAKDAQQLYNFARSAQAELVSLQPKAPYVGTLKQFQGVEKFWNEANLSNRPYLPYNADEKAPGPPQRQTPPLSSSGLMAEMQLAAEDMKRTTGIYDASLGAKSNETSGVAIRQRQMESQNSTSIYADNVIKGVFHTGRIIVDMIPRIYDTRRVIRILGEDDEEKMVEINQVYQTIQGEFAVNDMTAGKYDVRLQVGPNYATKRQEASEGMMQFIQAVPQAAALTADLVAKAQDWPDADKFAERLKPPGVGDDENEQVAMLQQQIMQMQQAMEQMQQAPEMQKAQAEVALKSAQAEKAGAEATAQQIENMVASGQMNAVISQLVQAEVMRALQGAMAPPGAF